MNDQLETRWRVLRGWDGDRIEKRSHEVPFDRL